MTKRYAILQKKLQELELEISHALSILPENPIIHQNLSEDIEQKLVFISNLLSAEIASRPTKPHHLTHIAQQLTQLEAAFHEWKSSRTVGLLDHVDNASSCSCTESCLNDDGEAASNGVGLSDFEDPEECEECLTGQKAQMEFPGNLVERKGDEATEFYDCVVDEKEAEEKMGVEEVGRTKMNKERKSVGLGKLCGAMASGCLIGMALMGFVLIKFSDCIQVEECANFVPPT